MPHELQRLLPRHFFIIDLAIAGLGQKDIAEVAGMSQAGIGLILRSPLVQDELARRRAHKERALDQGLVSTISRAKEVLESHAVDAAQKHVDLIHSLDENVAQRSATDILNRVFKQEGHQVGMTLVMPVVDIENLRRALKEADEPVAAIDAQFSTSEAS